MTTFNDFNAVPVQPTKVTPNMTAYIVEENSSMWVEVNGAHIRDQANEDYCDYDLNEFHELQEEVPEMLFQFVEKVCREHGLTYEKITDNTGDEPSYYYHIHNKKALIEAARKYVAERA